MSPSVRMAIARWQPAPEGANWDEITGAWDVLYTLIIETDRQTRRECS